MGTEANDDAAEKIQKLHLEMISRIYERANAYTNLVLLGGYAGAYAIWNFTRDQLPPRASIWIALLLGASLTTFVFFEIYKMIQNSRFFLQQRELVAPGMTPTEFLAKFEAWQQDISRSSFRLLVPIWVIANAVAVGTALTAICLLFYNFVTILLR